MTRTNNLDSIGSRLRWACLASVIINILLWAEVSGLTQRPPAFKMDRIEVSRVIIDKNEKVIPHKIIPKIIPKRKIVEKRTPPPPKQKENRTIPPPVAVRNKVMVAKADPKAPAKPEDHVAFADGNAQVGKAVKAQEEGNAAAPPPKKEEPPAPVKKEEAPPAPVVKKEEPPAPAPVVKKEEPAPPPVKVEPPRPKGPTKEAEPDNQVKPEIPDDLKKGQYKSFVRVKVEINEDGSFTPILRTSSGNPEIDRRVLESLKRWKWKPALKDGERVKSTQLFKFEFEVE